MTYFFYEDGYEFDEWPWAGIRTGLFGAFNLERQSLVLWRVSFGFILARL